HPPAVEVDVDAPVQVLGLVAVTQRAGGEVVVVLDVRGRTPHEVMPADDLAHGVQVAAFLQGQHLPAHQGGHPGEPGERHCAQHRVAFDVDVDVHEQALFTVGGAHRLEHDAAVTARSAQVRLVVDAQP